MGVASAADRGGKDDYAWEICNDDDVCLLDLRDRYCGELEQQERLSSGMLILSEVEAKEAVLRKQSAVCDQAESPCDSEEREES